MILIKLVENKRKEKERQEDRRKNSKNFSKFLRGT